MSIVPQRNLRLIPRSATLLDSTSGAPGEIFYDSTNNALRVFNGSTQGGTLIGHIVSGSTAVTAEQVQDIAAGLFSNSHAGISVSYNDAGAKLTLTVANQSWGQITGKPTLFSGSYTDLSNKPTLFSGSYTDLTNKPTLFSGSYTDLSNKPTLFSGSYTDLTDKPTIPVATRTISGTITGLVGNEVALGTQSGNSGQGAYAVAIGLSAGEVNQGSVAVAIGSAGVSNQGFAAVAIGYQAGQTGQGDSAIAIGRGAGKTNQAANSIVINATGGSINTTTADSLIIAPVRSATATANVLYYNTTTKEVTYAAPAVSTLTAGTGLALDSGTTFNGSAARTISLATVWGSPQSPGNPGEVITNISVDVYGRVTGIGAGTPSINSFSSIYVGATGSPPSGGTIVSADSSSDILYLVAGSNISLSADSMADSVTISASFTGPAFSAYANNTLQTITSGSQQKVLFQVEEFDTNSNFASSRFTPTVAGYYQLNSEVRLDGTSGTGEMMIVIWKNGSEYKRGTNQSGTLEASNFWAMQVSSLVYANGSTDFFEIYVQQGSGSSVTVTAVNAVNITWFNGYMVRGA